MKWYLTPGSEDIYFMLETAVTIDSPSLQDAIASIAKLKPGAGQNYVSEARRQLYHAHVSMSLKELLSTS